MTADLRDTAMGEEALAYIRECLRSENTLALSVLEKLDLTPGTVIAMLPEHVDPQVARDFRAGGIARSVPASRLHVSGADGVPYALSPVPNTDEWLASKILSFLAQHVGSACVFGDPYYEANSKLDTFAFKYQEEAYRAVLAPEMAQIMRTVSAVKCLPYFVGFMIAGGIPDEVLRSGESSNDHLRDMARRTEMLSVLAYDGESYLIWGVQDFHSRP